MKIERRDVPRLSQGKIIAVILLSGDKESDADAVQLQMELLSIENRVPKITGVVVIIKMARVSLKAIQELASSAERLSTDQVDLCIAEAPAEFFKAAKGVRAPRWKIFGTREEAIKYLL